MKRLLAFCLSGVGLAVCAETLFFDGNTDKDPLFYKVDEPIKFTVTLKDADAGNAPVKNRKLAWKRLGDDGVTESGTTTSDNPVVYTTTLKKPGFVYFGIDLVDDNGKTIPGKFNLFRGGAAADLDQIPFDPKPADFDSFWEEEHRKLYETPYTPKLTEVESKYKFAKVYRFELPTFDGQRPATGFLSIPRDAKPGSMSIYVRTWGWGFSPTMVLADPKRICVSVTRQGEKPDGDAAYYRDLGQNELKNFGFRNNEDRLTSDFYGVVMRNARILQYLKTLPEWDGKGLECAGDSFGAFQAVAMAAFEPQVNLCNFLIPFNSDVARSEKFGRLHAFGPRYTPALDYFDSRHFASRVKCQVFMMVFLGDEICRPSGQIEMFKNLQGNKILHVYQNGGHGRAYSPNPTRYVFRNKIVPPQQ